jgi:hypothetical protein
MAGNPPPYPPPYGFDPRSQRRFFRDQARAQRAAFRAQRAQMRYQMGGMRRGSILGPLALIAIGVVFLLVQTGRVDHLAVLSWYARWWPFLLVAAGLIVLAEWAVDQHLMRDPARPQYRRSLGGGIFFIFIFFIFAGLSMRGYRGMVDNNGLLFPGTHFDLDSLDELLGDKHESDQTIDASFPPGSSLIVFNPHGDVTVSGTSEDGRIHIAVHKQVYARTDSEADTKAQKLSPSAVNAGQQFYVTVPIMDGARADLIVTLPAASTATVTANHGDIHIASIQGSVAATANRGDIELSAITGPITAHINNGSSSLSAHSIASSIAIQGHANDLSLTDIGGPVTISGDFYGTTHLEKISAPVHFHTSRTDLQFARLDGSTDITSRDISSDQVLGPLILTTSNRNVNLDRVAGDISVTNRNGTIDVTAAPVLGNINIENRSGRVSATLPEGAGFQVDARATHGEVDSPFPLASSNTGNLKTLTGTVGAGGPIVRIVTNDSDISLNQASVPPVLSVLPASPKISLTPTPTPASKAARRPTGQHVLATPAP